MNARDIRYAPDPGLRKPIAGDRLHSRLLVCSNQKAHTTGLMAHHIYILECADGTYYTGYTTDVERRVAEHNEGDTGCDLMPLIEQLHPA